MKALLPVDLGIICGLVMGEGCIGLCKTDGRTRNHNIHYSLRVCVSNTDRSLLEWLLEITGIGAIKSRKKSKSHWKQGYVWELRIPEMKEFLETILPHMIIKEDQCRLALEYLALPLGNSREPVDPQVQLTREFIFRDFQTLNKKGSSA